MIINNRILFVAFIRYATKIGRFVLALLLVLSVTVVLGSNADDQSLAASKGLLSRMVPELVGRVDFRLIPKDGDMDLFELQTLDGRLIIGGNNGVSMASGLNWYLKYYCNAQVSLHTEQLNLPKPLPEIKKLVHITSPHQYRYYFNYCAFSYTLAWWDWKQWERMIDLMAMYGVNAPLSVTGLEGVWMNTGKRLGISAEQMQKFFVGPGYLPFGWMGCLDGWDGPLPNKWIEEHVDLEKKILERERSMGMLPILQGFTGHVPKALGEVNPAIKLVELNWFDAAPTFFIDPVNPYFIEVGKIFMEEQEKLFGTNHLYASDTFIEMSPKSNDTTFLKTMGISLYQSMSSYDPKAIWVLQSWAFDSRAQFWQTPQLKAFFSGIPQDKLLILEMYGERKIRREKKSILESGAFFGQPWVWCIIQNFGERVSMHGSIDCMATDLSKSMQQKGKEAGKMAGVGYIMEGLGWNPIIDDFQSDMVWREEIPAVDDWIKDFVNRRYGSGNDKIQNVWEQLRRTVYSRDRIENILICRPALDLDPKKNDGDFFREVNILPVWKSLLDCSDVFSTVRNYRFDLVNLARQTLVKRSDAYYLEMTDAYSKKDTAALKSAWGKMYGLILDLDRLLACDDRFLLGKWLEDAKRWGRNTQERNQYEWNARTMITTWAGGDYAAKEWAGTLKDFYAPRWKLFYDELMISLKENTPWNAPVFKKKIETWEEGWTKDVKEFSSSKSGEDVIMLSKLLYQKYSICPSLTTRAKLQ
jgi:alpha-N-acetylglucosaminidase